MNNALVIEVQGSQDSYEIFSIHNAPPGDFLPGAPDVAHYEAPSLRFEYYDSNELDLSEIISFEPDLPEEKRAAIMDCLQGKPSIAKLYCCDFSECTDGVRLFFVFSMRRLNDACIFECVEVDLRDFAQFSISSADEKEAYDISVYRLAEDPITEYSFYIEVLKGDAPFRDLRIKRSQTVEITY